MADARAVCGVDSAIRHSSDGLADGFDHLPDVGQPTYPELLRLHRALFSANGTYTTACTFHIVLALYIERQATGRAEPQQKKGLNARIPVNFAVGESALPSIQRDRLELSLAESV